MWPGYGENLRVLRWIIERCEGSGSAVETPIGYVPAPHSLDLDGLDVDQNAIDTLLSIDEDVWLEEIDAIEHYLRQFGERVPQSLRDELQHLRERFTD